jgi:flagellar motor protein MotB
MEDEGALDFNFWPSFADLMLSLVLVLVLVIFLVMTVITMGTVNLEAVKRNQRGVVDEIATSFSAKAVPIDQDAIGIWTTGGKDPDIKIRNEPTFQQVTFSEGILFQPNEFRLNEGGKAVLRTVGAAIKKRLDAIERIQIEGHADTLKTRYESNTHLAAFRAIEVFKFLQDPNELNIDPAEHLISATSFGEFNPVRRAQGGGGARYSRAQLSADNETAEDRGHNRRIELLLFYRR